MEVEQLQFDRPAYASATVAPGAANVAEVTITFRNVNGKPVAAGFFYLFLSDSAQGVGLTAVTASGAVGSKGAVYGTDVFTLVAKKALIVQPRTPNNVAYTLSITDAAKTAFKVCVQVGGVPQVVATLATASYG
jgi:hypothetical protein